MPDKNTETLQWLLKYLGKQKFILDNEKHLQEQMSKSLLDAGLTVPVCREVQLSDDRKSIIDFQIGDIGIEVKLRCSKRKMHSQLVRYCQTGKLTTLIVYTSTSIGLPKDINQVNIYYINPSHAWL